MRRPLAPQLAHDGPDLVAAARVQARGRLVEEQHLRARQQAGGDVEPAAHAAGVGPGRPISRLRQVEPLEQLAGAAAGLLTGQLEQAPEHLQVLPPGQQLVDRRELPRQADQLADSGRLPRHVAAEDLRPARIRGQQRGQNADQRGLARPVRAQQAKHHPRRNLEPGAIQRHSRPEALDHTLDPHRRHRRTTSVHPGHRARSGLDPARAVGTPAQPGGSVRGSIRRRNLLVVRCHVDLLHRAARVCRGRLRLAARQVIGRHRIVVIRQSGATRDGRFARR